MEEKGKSSLKVSRKQVFLAVISIILLGLIVWSSFGGHSQNLNVLKMELPQLVNYIRSFPVGAPLVLFGLVFLQGTLPVIPFFLVAGAGGIVYGIWWGVLLVWTGAVLGACATFAIARYFGKEMVEQWLAKRGWNFRYSDEQGFLAILVARLIPVVPSVVVNMVSGVSKVKFAYFGTATALGKLPWAFLYTSLGYNLTRGKTWAFYLALIIIAAVSVLAAYRWLSRLVKVKA